MSDDPASGAAGGRPLFGPEHVRRYLETGGEEGHDWQGVRTLILFTSGRRTGAARATPLIYGRDGERLVVVASKGGAPSHPAWFLNLSRWPEVEVQVGRERLELSARPAGPGERPRLWRLMSQIWPQYDQYQERTSRLIPVVVLERREEGRRSGAAPR